MSWAQTGELSALWSVAPQLTEVKVRGLVEDLGSIAAPNLLRFTRETSGLKRSELSSILAATWPKLEHLELWFGDANYGAEPSAEDAAPLLEGKGLPALSSLGICNFEFIDALVERLVHSPLLPRLKRLDLSKGCLTAEGAEVLIRHRARFAHLEAIDLSQNLVSEAAQAELRAALPKVTLDGQRLDELEEDMRFVAVGE